MSTINPLPTLPLETVLTIWHSETVRCGVDIKAFADAIIGAANKVANNVEITYDETGLDGHNSGRFQ